MVQSSVTATLTIALSLSPLFCVCTYLPKCSPCQSHRTWLFPALSSCWRTPWNYTCIISTCIDEEYLLIIQFFRTITTWNYTCLITTCRFLSSSQGFIGKEPEIKMYNTISTYWVLPLNFSVSMMYEKLTHDNLSH